MNDERYRERSKGDRSGRSQKRDSGNRSNKNTEARREQTRSEGEGRSSRPRREGEMSRREREAMRAAKQRRIKEKKRKARRKRWLIVLVTLLVLMAIGVGCVFAGLKFYEKKAGESVFDSIKTAQEIAASSTAADFAGGSKSYIYGADGRELADLSLNNESIYLTYEQIPENVINAFVAIEDRTFWTNSGVDVKGIMRILFNYVRSGGKKKEGASTITQQLVKLTYLTTDKTLSRKLKEIVIARELTKKYTKEELITFYCNICCFANGIYGINDAAAAYFGKEPGELTLSEAAYLCSIPNRPEYYNPRTNPDNALERRDKILKDMLEEEYITQSQYDAAIREKMNIHSKTTDNEDYNYETTYAINCATKYIMELQGFEFKSTFKTEEGYKTYQDEYNEAFNEAKHELYSGGYKVYTTIDHDAQKRLQAILDEALAEKESKLDNGVYQVQGSMTVIDNSTGKVIAVIGGRSQDELKGNYTLNRAYQGYAQPGSSIKPLVVYTPAMDTGEYGPNSVLQNIDVTEAKEEKLTVSEISEMEGDEITLRTAVENSLNGCAYWLFSQIGIKTGLSYLQEMGFSKIVAADVNMSSCLGGLVYGVTTEEMANAYYTLENDGIYKDANCIESIIDRTGRNIYEEPDEKQVYSKEAANKMTSVMKGVLTEGTAARSDWYDYTETEAAGKTGTTNDNKAGWFCGYTPYYTISVWVGCDTPTVINGLSGASYPLTIWQNAMLSLIQDKPAASFNIEEEEEEEEPEHRDRCSCSTRCTTDDRNTDCPVCRYDVWECTGRKAEASCICDERCDGDSLNEACSVCMEDVSACKGAVLTCTCSTQCTEGNVNSSCAFCARDYTSCSGTPATEPEETTPEETTTEAPTTEAPTTEAPTTEAHHQEEHEDPVDPPEEDEPEPELDVENDEE